MHILTPLDMYNGLSQILLNQTRRNLFLQLFIVGGA